VQSFEKKALSYIYYKTRIKKKSKKKIPTLHKVLVLLTFGCAKSVQSCMLIKKDCTLCKVIVIIYTFVEIEQPNDKRL
jgi:hypothetical protein